MCLCRELLQKCPWFTWEQPSWSPWESTLGPEAFLGKRAENFLKYPKLSLKYDWTLWVSVHFYGSEFKKAQRSGGRCTVVRSLWKMRILLNGSDWSNFILSLFFLLFPEKCYHFIFQRYRLEHYTVSSNWLALGTVFLFGLLSLSRSVALFRGWYFRFALCSPGPWARGLQKLCCFARRNQEPREVWRSLLQGKE